MKTEMTQEMLDKLAQPLDEALISTRPHDQARYIKGSVAIDQANDIFGRGNWGVRVVSVEMVGQLGCQALVEFYLFGELFSREVGFVEFAFKDGEDELTAKMYDTAYKGAATDGMKRNMRLLGPQFGNSFPHKGQTTAPSPQKPEARNLSQFWAKAAGLNISPEDVGKLLGEKPSAQAFSEYIKREGLSGLGDVLERLKGGGTYE